MSSSLTTSSAFSTASMKPDPGEQGDAIWAQKIAENTGHVYYREQMVPIFYNSTSSGLTVTGLFVKRAGQSYARVRFASNSGLGSITTTLSAFLSTSDYGNFGAADSTAATTNVTQTINADTSYTLELDISGLSNGTAYYLVVSHSSNMAAAHPVGFWLIYGASATY